MDITNLINYEQIFIGIPTKIPNLCSVYPVTLRQIAEIGSKNFYAYLNVFTLSKEDVKDFFNEDAEEKDKNPFMYHLIMAYSDEEYCKVFREAFKFFLHEEIDFLYDNQVIILGKYEDNRHINLEEFEAICKIVSSHNIMKDSDENPMDNPANKRAKEIIDKIRKGKQIAAKNKGENITFLDLVGSLAAKGNGVNPINVWDLTYYAFNDQFKRMQAIDDYENALAAIRAGADAKKVEIKPWIMNVQE